MNTYKVKVNGYKRPKTYYTENELIIGHTYVGGLWTVKHGPWCAFRVLEYRGVTDS